MELIELFVLIETQSLKFSSLILNFGVQVRNFEAILPDNNNLYLTMQFWVPDFKIKSKIRENLKLLKSPEPVNFCAECFLRFCPVCLKMAKKLRKKPYFIAWMKFRILLIWRKIVKVDITVSVGKSDKPVMFLWWSFWQSW